MGGSSNDQTIGYKYYLGLHFGICHGPVDGLRKIVVADRIAWSGYQDVSGEIDIDEPKLFGGDKREGGIDGEADVMMGELTQTANAYLSSHIDGLMPAFRGIMGVVYKGGLVAANNPYVKPWAFEVTRIHEGWSTGAAWHPDVAEIARPGSDDIVYPIVLTEDWTRFNEDYELTSGTNYWDETDSPYGGAVHGEINSGGSVGTMLRTLDEEVTPCRVQVKFIMPTIGGDADDDAVRISLKNGGTTLFQFNPRREILQDGSQRPHLWFGGGATTPIGVAALAAGTWYQFDISWNSTTEEWTAEITAIGGSVVATATGTRAGFIGDVDGIELHTDAVVMGEATSVETTYADLVLSKCAPGAPDMNPAHIVYEGLTNTVWGMGYPIAQIDNDLFEAAADAFAEEGLGLSMIWNQQTDIGTFLQQVLDHAGAVLYASPRTGKFALKLIRGDYDPDYLPVYDESNVLSVDNFQRAGYGETVNEITVVFRDQALNRDSSITVQDLANITAQGGVVSQTKQYPGISNSDTAGRIAERDLLAVSSPLAKAKITVNRHAWEQVPGDVIKLSWDKLQISELICRVLSINYGTLDDGKLVIELVEDVYGIPETTYAQQEPGGFEEPNILPGIVQYQDVIEAPYWDLVRRLSAADLDYVDTDAGYVTTVAGTENGTELGYTIHSRISPAEYEQVGQGVFVPTALVSSAVSRDDTVISYDNGLDIDEVEIGQRALIGSGRLAEWVEVTAIDGSVTVNRGILDTTPQEHLVGARIWFASEGDLGVDPTERATADDVDVKLTAYSGGGETDVISATAMSITLDQRQYRPYPPGKIRINGEAFPTLISDSLSITFVHRDRLQQTATYVDQDEASIGPEAGTTYNGYLYDDDTDVLIDSDTGITSPWAPTLSASYTLRLELESERDGVVSWQRQVRVFDYLQDGLLTEDDQVRVAENDELREIE